LIEFQGFGKIPRLFRDIVITEKIDGTNAAIGIVPFDAANRAHASLPLVIAEDGTWYIVYAQSRKRIISPLSDNHGFARWVWDNAHTLVADLGPGLHFGEWWGSGIQRGYGLEKGHKVFSLFNVKRWTDEVKLGFTTPCLDVVPVLYRGRFDTAMVETINNLLVINGSQVAPGFRDPEGIVVYHTAANELFKVTIENDEAPKSLVVNG
jgi:RNA ligase